MFDVIISRVTTFLFSTSFRVIHDVLYIQYISLIHTMYMHLTSSASEYCSFLCACFTSTAGMILHFQLPHLIDHYIIDPQYWFDLCALVISPSNVSQLIQREGIISRSRFRCT